MRPKMNDPHELAERILAFLRSSPRPVKRRELAEACGDEGQLLVTRERRVREAVDWLVLQGHPVMSDGVHGFRLAGNREEWALGLTLRRRALLSEALKLRRLKQMLGRMVFSRVSQPDLFGG
jgi:hypothetical protein